MTSYEMALAELGGVFARLDDSVVDNLVERIARVRRIARARRIVVFGGGRERLQIIGFAMRMFHMGLDASVEET